MKRRDFLTKGCGAVAGTAVAGGVAAADVPKPSGVAEGSPSGCRNEHQRVFGGIYEGAFADLVSFPMGGLGAGMICLEATGALCDVSLHHQPDLGWTPGIFAAVAFPGKTQMARVLEGPAPRWKCRPVMRWSERPRASGGGGLPRFSRASFSSKFPFGTVFLEDDTLPLQVKVTGWSPFEPGDADNASLPVVAMEYHFENRGTETVDAVFSYSSLNFLAEPLWFGQGKVNSDGIRAIAGGFQLCGGGAPSRPWDAADLAIWVDDPAVVVNAAWLRLPFGDAVAMAWKDIEAGKCVSRPAVEGGPAAPGATLFVPFKLAPGEQKNIPVKLAWYVGRSHINRPGGGHVVMSWEAQGWENRAIQNDGDAYRAWYTARFNNIDAVVQYWRESYQLLRKNTSRFTEAFYSSTLPPEVIEAVSANLSILKTPTVLRQADGRLWGWAGCSDEIGLFEGTCTHVWGYAQTFAHLFPNLERTLRETEFNVNQREDGHQDFQSALPIRPTPHNFCATADGQLGAILRTYRDWRICGDTGWLRGLWPKVRSSLDYCIRTWDPDHTGTLVEPHHVTWDVKLWGPNSMTGSIYLGALKAAIEMGRALGDDVTLYKHLYASGKHRVEQVLFNGEFFVQKTQWKGLKTPFPDNPTDPSLRDYVRQWPPEAAEIAAREGPPYQYGEGCVADGVMGAWLALVCGSGHILDQAKVRSHLSSVFVHNLSQGQTDEEEGGLVNCTWPRGGCPTIPFAHHSGVWTGVEYQVAGHMMMMGMPEQGLQIVRTCRQRFNGRWLNPFDEIESGHWFARAMSSYGLLQAMSGARYDAIERVLYLSPAIKGDFSSFLSTATGYGTVGVKGGKPFLKVAAGEIPYVRIAYIPA